MNAIHTPFAAGPERGARPTLRVAFVTETYPPEVNGVATTTAKFVDGLRHRGHAIEVVRPRQIIDGDRPAARGAECLMRGMPIPRYPHLRMGLPSTRALLERWSADPPDVVHVATEGPLGWSALRAALRLGLPVTSDFRTNFQAYSRHYGIGWLRRPILGYLQRFHNRCATTMVPTEALRRELEGEGFARLVVVPRGVDASRFSPAHRSPELRAAWGLGPADVAIGYVGRIAPEKNLPLLAAAFTAVRRALPRARLVLVGDGPSRPELQPVLGAHAVFAGVRSGHDLAAHYASLDLFAFPSLTETFGNVVTEALASGLPVVAFDHAAAGELIADGVEGLLARPGDDDEFVDLVLDLALDADLRTRMGARARSLALGLSWESVVARMEAHLAAACAASRLRASVPELVAA